VNQLDEDYKGLLGSCLYNSIEKTDRTGTGTLSVFGRQIKHRMKDGFPLLTTKKMAIKTMMTELKWFLKGDTNIKYLVDNGCHIWDGDAYKNYCKIAGSVKEPDYDIHIDDPNQNCTRLMTQEEFINKIKTNDEFANEWGDLGPIYGTQWREWNYTDIDQIANLINELKTNPDSRRLMVSAWNVGELNQMVLPPCHYGFQVYTRDLGLDERIELYNSDKLPMNQSLDYLHEQLDSMGVPRKGISLMWNQRSVDTFLGLPFNIASYATLLIILGKEVNMMPDYLIGSLGDVHLYKNHIEQARELITRTPYKLPKLEITNCDIQNGEFDWELINYQSHPSIKAPLSN
jgi:thymidylate synthase